MARPQGDPRLWTPAQWAAYNAWETAQPEPPRWGPHENAAQFYSSEEWLRIVCDSLASHKVSLGIARRSDNKEAVRFYEAQITACKVELNLAEIKTVAATAQQERLFT